ncbi:MAG: hypothetical protein ICV71_05470 [Thermoleophilia bacterium]|nr:hypothetical protein [Thermoleophilia bacterium]MDQ3859370.1 hypothetical protein [Actinomycetota bacterium]
MSVLARLRARVGGEADPAAIERMLRERFRFLEERQGFELARSKRIGDGAAVAYANRAARRAVVVFARRGRGAWAGVAPLRAGGTLRPLDRAAVERGDWRELQRVDLGTETRSLDEAIARLARSLGGGRD